MADERHIATVTQINNYIKALLEQVPVLQNIWIKGEISNFKKHSSGHIYLTLKDSGAVLKAVMFKGAAYGLTFTPKDGMSVIAHGKISVYEAGGQYQMYIDSMESCGEGDLYLKFEALKKKLDEEGLFDEARKKPIPKFPQKIGIITSPTGAAIRDMINILKRRCPMVKAIIYPCLVQGDGASKSIEKAISYFNEEKNVDVLIVGRGGGSIEDLWAFNEEVTARAISLSKIPVISAVGHETDFTISDFVSDLRAPTPSAAAELAVPDMLELQNIIGTSKTRMATLLKQKLVNKKNYLDVLCKHSSLSRFEKHLIDLHQTVDRLKEACEKSYINRLEHHKDAFSSLCASLSALSPLSVYERGFSTVKKDGEGVYRVKDINEGDKINIRLFDGEMDCMVEKRRLYE